MTITHRLGYSPGWTPGLGKAPKLRAGPVQPKRRRLIAAASGGIGLPPLMRQGRRE